MIRLLTYPRWVEIATPNKAQMKRLKAGDKQVSRGATVKLRPD